MVLEKLFKAAGEHGLQGGGQISSPDHHVSNR
jgi:hypothetical protein